MRGGFASTAKLRRTIGPLKPDGASLPVSTEQFQYQEYSRVTIPRVVHSWRRLTKTLHLLASPVVSALRSMGMLFNQSPMNRTGPSTTLRTVSGTSLGVQCCPRGYLQILTLIPPICPVFSPGRGEHHLPTKGRKESDDLPGKRTLLMTYMS